MLRYESKLNLFLLNIASMVASLDNIIIAYIISSLISFTTKRNTTDIIKFIIISSTLIIIVFIANIFKNYLVSNAKKQINTKIRYKLFENIIFSEKVSNRYLNFLTNDYALLEKNGINSEIQIMSYSYSLLFSFFVSLFLSWEVTLLFLIGSFVPFIISNTTQNKINESSKKWSNSSNEYTNNLKNIIDGKKTIAIYNGERNAIKKNKTKIDILEKSLFNMNFVTDNSNALVQFIGLITSLIIPFIVGMYLVINNSIKLSTFFAVVQLSNTITGPIMAIIQLNNQMNSIKDIKNKIIRKIDQPIKKIKKKNRIFKELKFENLGISINNRNIVHDLSFEVKPKEKIAVIGESGSGKSSLFNLILNNDFHSSGKYYINNTLITNDNISSYSNLFSFIEQNTYIYNESFVYNITFGKSSDVSLEHVINKAGLRKIVDKNGLDFNLGENGVNLSGGEKQRIGIARALYANRNIILADEISSSLDKYNSNEVHKTLFNSDKTVIEIIHNYSENDLCNYDKVINLNEYKKS